MSDDFAAVGRIRARYVCGLVLTLLLGLSVRLVQIQVVDGPSYATEALGQLLSHRTLEAPRGRILDRNGAPLAVTRPCWTVFVDPSRIRGEDERRRIARELAGALGLQAEAVLASLDAAGGSRYVRVARGVTDEAMIARVRALDLAHAGGVEVEPLRVYPCGEMAAHVIGVARETRDACLGVERWRDNDLRGTPGRRRAFRDSGRNAMVGMFESDRAPIAGRDVRLTIDRRIQSVAEAAADEIAAEWSPETICIVLLDPRCGDVIAMVNRPSFDPNDLRPNEVERWRNRVVCDRYIPGSTLKPLIAAAALDAGVVRPEDTIECENGSWTLPGRTLHDVQPHGTLSVRDVVVKSSNIGMGKITARLGADATIAGLRRFGIYRPTGSGFPGEPPELALRRESPRVERISFLPSVAMGQQIIVTPLQLARAFCAIAADGRLPTPRFFLDAPIGPYERAISPAVAAEMRETLGQAVERGTGRRAALKRWRVGGKTGTAEIMAGRGTAASPSRVDGHVSSFIGFAPVEAPRFVVLVMAVRPDHGSRRPWGGTISGPAAGKILEAALTIHGVEEAGHGG